MLYAGLILNAVFLESVASSYTLAGNLTRLSILSLVYGAFLGLAIFYVPARLSAHNSARIEDALQFCVGPQGSWIFGKIIFPAWIFAWFSYNTMVALSCMDASLFHKDWSQPNFVRRAFVGLIWLILIAPAAKEPFAKLAKFSIFTTKVSITVIFGLALSSRAWVFETMAGYADSKWEAAMPLETQVLLWAAPPLLFAGRLTQHPKITKQAILSIVAIGIMIPVLFAVLSGILTMAGAEGISGIHPVKIPSYLNYAYKRPGQGGWVKLLVMVFTFVAATRFAANLGVSLVTRRPRLWVAAALTIIVVTLVNALSFMGGGYGDLIMRGWQYTSAPFAPLAGVICAAYVKTRNRALVFSPTHQQLAFLAWIAGCAITFAPTWSEQYPDAAGVRPAWIIAGWFVSFTATWLLTLAISQGRVLERISPTRAVSNPDSDAPIS